ncbi:MAG: hypothetical protein COT15_01440 [Candidatus Diapherotrites archaeon CG08_land_8_20_14_0_20_34_12]|nr:MAG: hypothetical protein COT15_01440 [Candidatus Diapherotrites archaeon CG08_land_8_20_14_0_20_34_12]
MHKKLLLFVLIILIPTAFADVKLLEPTVKQLSSGETTLLGNAQPGETVTIVVSKQYTNGSWDSILLDDKTLPLFWNYSIEEFDKSFTINLMIPKASDARTQNIRFIAKNNLIEDIFTVQIVVTNTLLKCGIASLNKTILVGETTTFALKCVNDSIAEHSLEVKSNLPTHWFKPLTITMKPNTSQEYQLEVRPQGYGKYDFKFNADSKLNNNSSIFDASLTVNPTLKGKFFSVISGLPFTAPSIITFYLIDAILTYIS